MKNLYLLPSNKPSRILRSNIYGDITFLDPSKEFKFDQENWTFLDLYIISNEEIKDTRLFKDKWQLEKGQMLNKFPTYLTDLSECKLVIMTTDSDLIKDGVQEIDDEFLKWYIKNLSCETIEVTFETLWLNKRFGGTWQPFTDENANQRKKNYKIIFPKEGIDFIERDSSDLQKQEISGKEIKQFDKQETLEEAAMEASELGEYDRSFESTRKSYFIEGVKWNQRQIIKLLKDNDYGNEPVFELIEEWFKQIEKK